MKPFISILAFVLIGCNINAQTPCTLILKNHSVINVYHMGTIKPDKNKKRKGTDELESIIIQGMKDNIATTINDFSDIKEIKISNFQSTSSKSKTYCFDAKIKYNNGDESTLKEACIKCAFDKNSTALLALPIHIKSNTTLIKQEIDLHSIETLIF